MIRSPPKKKQPKEPSSASGYEIGDYEKAEAGMPKMPVPGKR